MHVPHPQALFASSPCSKLARSPTVSILASVIANIHCKNKCKIFGYYIYSCVTIIHVLIQRI